YFQVLGGRLLCMDLHGPSGRRQGLYPRSGWFGPRHAVRVGAATLRLARGCEAAAGAALVSWARDPPPLTLEVTAGGHGVWHYRTGLALILIGTDATCQVRLRHAAVSRYHCALVNTPSGLWAVDLLGRGGIAHNGTAVRAARVGDGDELRVGGF